MPITISAKKALRRDRRRSAVNKRIKKQLEDVLNKARRNPSKKNFSVAESVLDRAAKKGLIHLNKAARLKSRLGKLVKPKKS